MDKQLLDTLLAEAWGGRTTKCKTHPTQIEYLGGGSMVPFNYKGHEIKIYIGFRMWWPPPYNLSPNWKIVKLTCHKSQETALEW